MHSVQKAWPHELSLAASLGAVWQKQIGHVISLSGRLKDVDVSTAAGDGSGSAVR